MTHVHPELHSPRASYIPRSDAEHGPMNMVVVVGFRATTPNEGHREKAARNQRLSNVPWCED